MKARSTTATRPIMNAPASEDASVSEPLISWGSSVNVNEDLRRSIRAEIDTVDASIDTLQSHIKNEDRTSAHLAKDFAHARAEMVELRRSAADELDSATMKDQVRQRLKSSLRELMSPTSVVSSSDNAMDTTNDAEGQVTDDTAKSKPPATTRAYLKERAAELKELATSIAKDKEEMMEFQAKKDEYECQTQAIHARIVAGKLEEELAAAKKETALRREERDNEERRKRNLKEAVQQKRAECAHYAQQIGDQVCIVVYYYYVSCGYW